MSKTSSKEVTNVYSGLVTSLVRLSQEAVPSKSDLERRFRTRFEEALREIASNGFDIPDLSILDSLNVGSKLSIECNSWIVHKKNKLSTFNYASDLFADYCALFSCVSYYKAKNADNSIDLSHIANKMSEIKPKIDSAFKTSVRAYENIIAKKYNQNADEVLASVGMKRASKDYKQIKELLDPKVRDYLISLSPDFQEYKDLISGYYKNMDTLIHKFHKLYADVVSRLDNGPSEIQEQSPITEDEAKNSIAFCNNLTIKISQLDFNDSDEEVDLPSDESPLMENESDSDSNRYFGESTEVLEDFVRDFNPSGVSYIMIEFLGQSTIDAARELSVMENKSRSRKYSVTVADMIMREIMNHPGNSFSKLVFAATICFQLSD